MVDRADRPNRDSLLEEHSVEGVPAYSTVQDAGAISPEVGSILVADCGSSFTRVSLLQAVETGYCFVAHATAPTTAEPPWSDMSLGIRHAIEHIVTVTRRQLLDQNGMLILPEVGGQGVDQFVLTSSAGQPLRVVLAGLISQVSLNSLKRAAKSAYVQVVGTIARDGGDEALSDEEKIALIREGNPDMVWVAGGTNNGSRQPVRDLVEAIALACTLVDQPPRPSLVYAGNASLRSEIVDLVGEEVELAVIENVRPDLDAENLASAQAEFQSAYVERKLQRLSGIGNVMGWTDAPVLSTAQAMGHLMVYLERLYDSGKGVLCADVGSASTVLAAAFAEKSGQPVLNVATDLGLGYNAPALLERCGLESISRWLPFDVAPGQIEGVLLNKGIRPTSVPQDRQELLIEQAAAREALRLVMAQARERWQLDAPQFSKVLTPPVEPIIATGGILSQAPRPGQTVLMLLDAIEPVGITTLVLDQYGLASALGAIAVTQPQAAVQALDAGAFSTLATVIAPVGRARPGEIVMNVNIAFEQGGELEIEVKYGSLELIPLRTGEKATLRIKSRRGISLGRVKSPVEVNGGILGLVVDARGRPLRLPASPRIRRERIEQWLWDVGS